MTADAQELTRGELEPLEAFLRFCRTKAELVEAVTSLHNRNCQLQRVILRMTTPGRNDSLGKTFSSKSRISER